MRTLGGWRRRVPSSRPAARVAGVKVEAMGAEMEEEARTVAKAAEAMAAAARVAAAREEEAKEEAAGAAT